jgi:hypothetical protein
VPLIEKEKQRRLEMRIVVIKEGIWVVACGRQIRPYNKNIKK